MVFERLLFAFYLPEISILPTWQSIALLQQPHSEFFHDLEVSYPRVLVPKILIFQAELHSATVFVVNRDFVVGVAG